MSVREWYRIQSKAESGTATIFIFDEIGQSFYNDQAVTAKRFVADLQALPAATKRIVVQVNSPGGDPFEATVIANSLREQHTAKGRTVDVEILGLAASAATIVICAGQRIAMATNALMMIHNPYMLALGDAEQLRKDALALDKIRDAIIATYGWVAKKTPEELSAMMAAETWLDCDEAIAAGFATERLEVDVEPEIVNRLPRRVAATLRAPAPYRARLESLIAPAVDATMVARLCNEADLDLAFTLPLVESNAPIAEVRAKISAEQQRRATAAARASEIRRMCGSTRTSALADGYVRSGLSVLDVGVHLTSVTALMDRVEIDTSLAEPGQTRYSDPYGVHGKATNNPRDGATR